MFERKKLHKLDDFFLDLSKRQEKGVYFYRINGYNPEIDQFIRKYYEQARRGGVIIEGKLPNPDEKNLAYYEEMMGMTFQLDRTFFDSRLQKWMPRMSQYARANVADSLYSSLQQMQRDGKTENMLKNAYIKVMCWLYYKFERIANQLGTEQVPKLLYEGDISKYELMFFSILSNAGCDIVLLQYHGDENYKKLDAGSLMSEALQLPGMKAFPSDYSLKEVLRRIQEEFNNERLYGTRPQVLNCTNAWIEGKGLDDFRKAVMTRGEDPKLFYNCFYRMDGVEDKLTYLNELYQFYLELKNAGRKVVVVDQQISAPTMEEIASVNRKNYQKQDQMLMDLSSNLKYTANVELQRLMVKAFLDIMLEEAKKEDMNLNKLTNKAVYMICWMKRYQGQLFSNWKMPDVSCFVHMGSCKNENETLFLRILARLPVDVLVLKPNQNENCELSDPLLYELKYSESMVVDKFPCESAELQIGTAAFHAERELDQIMYQDSGIYRNQQYAKAEAITLKTMYEEIALMWNEEMKFRPNFSTADESVNLPVIYAKVLGVKDGDVQQYWRSIKALLTEDTCFIDHVPYLDPTKPNPMKAYSTEFYKNGKIQKAKIKNHSQYPYGFLREEIQDYILDKLQLLIDQKIIKGTFENGTEYTIVATIMNLPKDITRMLQKFDFTKKNPKLVYLITGEEVVSLEDAILVSFLNLVGFDILFFVPTGYQNIEKHLNQKRMEEHQIGEYMYDLRIPNMASISATPKTRWRDKIFKRGI